MFSFSNLWDLLLCCRCTVKFYKALFCTTIYRWMSLKHMKTNPINTYQPSFFKDTVKQSDLPILIVGNCHGGWPFKLVLSLLPLEEIRLYFLFGWFCCGLFFFLDHSLTLVPPWTFYLGHQRKKYTVSDVLPSSWFQLWFSYFQHLLLLQKCNNPTWSSRCDL